MKPLPTQPLIIAEQRRLRQSVAKLMRQLVSEARPLFAHMPTVDGVHRWSAVGVRQADALRQLQTLVNQAWRQLGVDMSTHMRGARDTSVRRSVTAAMAARVELTRRVQARAKSHVATAPIGR